MLKLEGYEFFVESARWEIAPTVISIMAIMSMRLKLSVVPARGSSVGVGVSGVGVRDSVGVGASEAGGGEGPSGGGSVGTQVTVTSSQIGPKVSWALTFFR